MQWTMPPRVLQIVASLIALAAAAAFLLGVLNAPQRGGRLPGEKGPGSAAGAAAPIDATDATPLSDERIEGPPQPTPEELAAKAKAEADAKRADAEQEAAGGGNAPAPVLNVPRAPPSAPAGNATAPEQTLGGPPASDEPPH